MGVSFLKERGLLRSAGMELAKYLRLLKSMRFAAMGTISVLILLFSVICVLSRFPNFEPRYFASAAQLFVPIIGAWIPLCLSNMLFNSGSRDICFSMPLSNAFLGFGHVLFGWGCFGVAMGACFAITSRIAGVPCDPQLYALLCAQTAFYGGLCFAVIAFTQSMGLSICAGFAYLLIAVLSMQGMPVWFRIYPDITGWPRGAEARHGVLCAAVWSLCFLCIGQIRVSRRRG